MDSDLDAIRAKRLAELNGSSGGGSGSGSSMPNFSGMQGQPGGAGGGDAESAQKRAQEDESRRTVMSQILSPDARERLSRIALVRPQRAQGIEDLLMRMAKGGQLRGQVSEEQLITVLDQVEAAEKGSGGKSDEGKSNGKITFSRKKALDSDDDFDL